MIRLAHLNVGEKTALIMFSIAVVALAVLQVV